jgi:glycosyltransferase involved in cell wall biosynthesis
MKIVHICWEYIDNMGYQEQLLPKAHSRLGNDVVVLTPKKIFSNIPKKNEVSQIEGEYIIDNVKICRMNYLSIFGNRFTIIKHLYNKLVQEKPDVIFVHMLQSLSVFTAVKYKEKNPNVKLLVDSHADNYNSSRNFLSKHILHGLVWRFVANRNLNKIDKLFYIAPMSKSFLVDMYKIPESKLYPLYLGADVSGIEFDRKQTIRLEYRRKLNIPVEDFVIISGGKINKQKGIDMILEALSKINERKIHFILFGSTDAEFEIIIDKYLSSTINLHYVKWINHNELFNYFFASDLALFPGTQSVIWQQSICSGLPIIVKKWPGGEYLDLGGNIIYLTKNTTEELIEIIQNLYKNKDDLIMMRKVAETEALKHFSYDEIARKSLI